MGQAAPAMANGSTAKEESGPAPSRPRPARGRAGGRAPLPAPPPPQGVPQEVWERLSPFRRRVFALLCRVPPGAVTTYGALARALGCGSARAVGQALRHNPLAPLVPCHRVIAADLTPGGFRGARTGEALAEKRALLAREGVVFAADGSLAEPCRLAILGCCPTSSPMTIEGSARRAPVG
ncbi:MAG: MGMT family protein [Lentisphaeria bacterium]|nr:MGMT family protein [Lentisphaeria bacterium]